MGKSAPSIGKVGMGKMIPSRDAAERLRKRAAAAVFIGTVVTNVGGAITYSPP